MIKLININKEYKDKFNNGFSLKEINFSINSSEIFGIIGKSGSGKSTLLNIMGLLEDYDSGELYLNNILVNNINQKDKISFKKSIGYVFQDYNLLKNLTMLENIALPLKLKHVKKEIRDVEAKKLIKYIGLSGLEDRYPHQLSGGEKQRVAIARALINEPKILLCDEITSALDFETSYEIINLLKQINKDLNITIVFVSHDLNIVKLLCQRVLIMKNGVQSDLIELNNNSNSIIKEFDYKTVLLGDSL